MQKTKISIQSRASIRYLPPPNKTNIKLTSLISPLPLIPPSPPNNILCNVCCRIGNGNFSLIASYYLINTIVLVNTKSENNHTKNICMISTLHYFCPSPTSTYQLLVMFAPSPPPPLNNTITITIPTATISPPPPLHPPTHKSTK